jgi:hypothetical protein
MAGAHGQRIEERFGRFFSFDEDSERYHSPSRIELGAAVLLVLFSVFASTLPAAHFCENDRTCKTGFLEILLGVLYYCKCYFTECCITPSLD